MSSEETFLEAFIEGLSTLPNDVKRNMELIRDLDSSSAYVQPRRSTTWYDGFIASLSHTLLQILFHDCFSDALQRLQKLQQEYVFQLEEKMAQVEVVQGPDGSILGLREAPELEPLFPSTSELRDYVHLQDPTAATRYEQIQALEASCLQKADEKVAVARQAWEWMDAQVQRLDHDLSAMETLLQVGYVL